MRIAEISEHSIALDLIAKCPIVLDIGCRGYGFGNYFLNKVPGSNVFFIDIDDLPENPEYPTKSYHQLAIASEVGKCGIKRTSDPQATSIMEGEEIEKFTLAEFCKKMGIPCIDILKLDVEGDELNILNTISHPIAKQVSVEFHAHCRPEQTKEVLDELLDRMELYYDIYNRKWESRHGAGFNYWDVLLIKKN